MKFHPSLASYLNFCSFGMDFFMGLPKPVIVTRPVRCLYNYRLRESTCACGVVRARMYQYNLNFFRELLDRSVATHH